MEDRISQVLYLELTNRTPESYRERVAELRRPAVGLHTDPGERLEQPAAEHRRLGVVSFNLREAFDAINTEHANLAP